MSSIREYTQKITSLKGMGRITKTMKMVSAGYYRRAQELLRSAKDYNHNCERITATIESLHPDLPPPLTNTSAASHILIISSNRGLCGSYNAAVSRLVRDFVLSRQIPSYQLTYSYAGAKALTLLRDLCPPLETFDVKAELPTAAECLEMAMRIYTHYQDNRFSKLFIVYTKSHNALFAEPVMQQLIPFIPKPPDSPPEDGVAEPEALPPQPLLLPDPLAVRNMLRFQTTISRLFLARAHAAAAEHAARRTSMDNASTNISKLTDTYVQLRNTARQSNITRELTEIVSGAESLGHE